ncbi:type I restriction enzyme HsdR N-terminal domain-containing protein [Lipingzhangella sp. LS1_29]|uniref:Type I restriction enzyme HsdR N-terminal domain-containing protein n=1 Tax=Lipingzhangella rawalii TaxID=2055835 RepID=A0ABU2HAI9_9ACTN|nr:type I restriction endonuclease [Lipingzhangella rawalii]MDS1271609.1 type I restriction enzyme HsdR N-terminal domain-containing protein [Lipingzhangella rawalii]
MEFRERVATVAAKVHNHLDATETEEATKTAFVMPFISTVLGYDVFNPTEVVPEFTADVGSKKGEKIDYAIMRDDEVQILIECKKAQETLSTDHASQLFRYFTATNARIGVLTNGITYEFYTDLDSPNRMDEKPFLVLDLTDVDETLLPELRKLSRDWFDLDSVISAAEKLRYLGEIKRILATQFHDPEDDWIRFFATRVYSGSFTKRVREQFSTLVLEASSQFLNDQVNSRIKNALSSSFPHQSTETDDTASHDGDEEESEETESSGIVTTLEELDGFRIVKAIACSEVSPDRISYRDSKSYFAIFLDDNNRKPIARLHFNAKKRKYLGTFDENKKETRNLLGSLDDIYLHRDTIRNTVRNYLD